jgi:anti-sigma regulatory factor (Ser/Thr protein kinase)
LAVDSSSCFEAQLPAELSSVVAARRLVESAAASWGLPPDVCKDAALAVSELVTNAVLHTGTVLTVRVRRLGRGIRLEVYDGSTTLPLLGTDRPEQLLATRSMTGRGLALLAGIVDRWGADPLPNGKSMWAEIGTGPRRLDAMHSSGLAAPSAPPEFPVSPSGAPEGVTSATVVAHGGRRVHLIGVPVRLLVESARQFADLQREIQVVGLDHNGPKELVALAQTSHEISARIGSLRQAGADVAEAALARGESTIDFDVEVGDDAVDAFDRLGSLIRWVGDALVRRHLLTVPPSDEVTAYRHWYRDEISSQLGGRAPQPCPLVATPA